MDTFVKNGIEYGCIRSIRNLWLNRNMPLNRPHYSEIIRDNVRLLRRIRNRVFNPKTNQYEQPRQTN